MADAVTLLTERNNLTVIYGADLVKKLVDDGTSAVGALVATAGGHASTAGGHAATATTKAAQAALSASTAESVSGPTYASIAAGETATAVGVSFAVDNGDGTVTVYLRTSGGSTAQRTLATTAALGGPGGAALVEFKYPTTHGVQDDVAYFLSERATAKKLGIRADGADQTDNLRNAFEDLQGGVIDFSEVGEMLISEEVRLERPISLIGAGGGFRNFGAQGQGCRFKLADNSLLTPTQAMLRVLYQGADSDSRLPLVIRDLAFDGNKANNINGNGIIFQGARYAEMDRLIVFSFPGDGVQLRTGGSQAATQANTTLHKVRSVYNGGNGFDVSMADSIIADCVAGANGAAGYNVAGGKELIGCKSWNNAIDGFYISASTDLTLGLCIAYDNNRNGFRVQDASRMGSLMGCTAQRNGRDLLGASYSTANRSGVHFVSAVQGWRVNGLRSGNSTAGVSGSIQSQTYGLYITHADADIDYDYPIAPSDGVAINGTNTGADLIGPVFDASNSGARLNRLRVGTGSLIRDIRSATRSWTITSLANGASASVALTSSSLGIAATDTNLVLVPTLESLPANCLISATVTGANTVTVSVLNHSGSSLTLSSKLLRVMVMKF